MTIIESFSLPLETIPGSSINDLKAHYRGRKYVEETLKLLPDKPAPSLL